MVLWDFLGLWSEKFLVSLSLFIMLYSTYVGNICINVYVVFKKRIHHFLFSYLFSWLNLVKKIIKLKNFVHLAWYLLAYQIVDITRFILWRTNGRCDWEYASASARIWWRVSPQYCSISLNHYKSVFVCVFFLISFHLLLLPYLGIGA